MPSHVKTKNSYQKEKLIESSNGRNSLKRKAQVSSHSLFTAGKNKSVLLKYNEQLLRQLGIDNMAAGSYISSSQDQPKLITIKKVDLLKKFGGRGVFAHVDIPAGTVLGRYTGEEFPSKKEFIKFLTAHKGADNSYAMNVGKRIIDARRKGNFTRYINFSDSQTNVEFRETKENNKSIVVVIATKDIKVGQQLLVDYNHYDPRASTEFFFLGPEDGWQSASEVLKSHAAQYVLLDITRDFPLLGLKKHDCIYGSYIGTRVAENSPLLSSKKQITHQDIHLPFLKTTPDHRSVLDFNKADSFTPLMFASYLGQLKNVEWLIKHGAHCDQQQNHSGNSPLFFALEGYREHADERDTYMAIIQALLSAKASLSVHDRADRTFIHKASSALLIEDFRTLIKFLSKNAHEELLKAFSYVDNNNYDPLLFCLANRDFDKAAILLEIYPKYFHQNYIYKHNKSLDFYHKKVLLHIIDSYDANEKLALRAFFENVGVNPNSKFMKALDLPQSTAMSMMS